MSDEIRVNYPALQEMSRHCSQVSERLAQTQQMAMKIAAQMNAGALVGSTGEAFAAALSGPFVSALLRLQQKFQEEAADINGAIADMQAADKSAGGNF